MCEETAKQDRDHCTYRLHRLEMGVPLIENLDEIADQLCQWLTKKGFRAAIDPTDSLVINVEWGELEQEEEDKPVWTVPATFIEPPTNHTTPINRGPWFDWLNNAQIKPPVTPKT